MNRPIRRLTAFAIAWLLIAGCIVERGTITASGRVPHRTDHH